MRAKCYTCGKVRVVAYEAFVGGPPFRFCREHQPTSIIEVIALAAMRPNKRLHSTGASGAIDNQPRDTRASG